MAQLLVHLITVTLCGQGQPASPKAIRVISPVHGHLSGVPRLQEVGLGLWGQRQPAARGQSSLQSAAWRGQRRPGWGAAGPGAGGLSQAPRAEFNGHPLAADHRGPSEALPSPHPSQRLRGGDRWPGHWVHFCSSRLSTAFLNDTMVTVTPGSPEILPRVQGRALLVSGDTSRDSCWLLLSKSRTVRRQEGRPPPPHSPPGFCLLPGGDHVFPAPTANTDRVPTEGWARARAHELRLWWPSPSRLQVSSCICLFPAWHLCSARAVLARDTEAL